MFRKTYQREGPNIGPFAVIISQSFSFPSNINSSHKIQILGPSLSHPRTCLIAAKYLHFPFQELHYYFIQVTTFSLPESTLHYYFIQVPAYSLPGSTLLLHSGTYILTSTLHHYFIQVTAFSLLGSTLLPHSGTRIISIITF